jgi:hypothetical protein
MPTRAPNQVIPLGLISTLSVVKRSTSMANSSKLLHL